MAVERKPGAEWPHWPGRAPGAPRHERLERRLFREGSTHELEETRAAIRRLEARVEELEQEVRAEDAPAPDDGYLLFVSAGHGYVLRGQGGGPPAVGARLSLDEGEYVVVKLGASPLPGDPRPCAYLQLVR